MSFDKIITGIAAIAAIILPLMKLNLDRGFNFINNQHKKYKFIKEFISDIEEDDSIHPLVIQHGASILFGGYLEKEHVKHLLQLRISTRTLLNYRRFSDLIDYNVVSSKLIYKENFKTLHQRKARKRMNIMYYCGFAGIPIVFLFYAPVFSKGTSMSLFFLVIFSISFILAFFNLASYYALKDAEVVVEASNKIHDFL